MLVDNAFKKLAKIRNESYEIKVLFFYRFMSLLFTSIFYLVGDFSHSISNKAAVVVCLTIASILLTYLYVINQNSTRKIIILIFIETIGNSFILIPSGGLNSPYVWYALNTFLIAYLKLSKRFCWLNLITYLSVSTGVVFFAHFRGEVELKYILNVESNFILSFILITTALRILANLIKQIQEEQKKLAEINERLLSANAKIKESMEHIMALYQTVHSFTSQRDENDLIRLLINYTKMITKANTVFFISLLDGKQDLILMDECSKSDDLKIEIRNKITEDWNNIEINDIVLEIGTDQRRFIAAAVKSTYKTYGVLGLETAVCKEDIFYKDNSDQLQFLAELSSIVLERAYLEEVNERLVIAEEQNRIANEIHDSTLQRLFSMSCGVFVLVKNIDKVTKKQIKEELGFVGHSIDTVIRELRSTIYGLSWKKEGINTFEEDVNHYINEIKRLNNVDICFTIEGDQELLSSRQKKGFYRIICEGIGNGIRHGKATSLEIVLHIDINNIQLNISDNGAGFNYTEVMNDKRKGLGIRNIHHLVYSLNGKILFDSVAGQGTIINVVIPRGIGMIDKEEAV
ncbi:MAG: sensor histidine kinase [Bacillota bacterium]